MFVFAINNVDLGDCRTPPARIRMAAGIHKETPLFESYAGSVRVTDDQDVRSFLARKHR